MQIYQLCLGQVFNLAKSKKGNKNLVETNKLAEAQTIILDELDKQYGGSAEAAAKFGAGPLIQLKDQFSDLMEDIGALIMGAMVPLLEVLKK